MRVLAMIVEDQRRITRGYDRLAGVSDDLDAG